MRTLQSETAIVEAIASSTLGRRVLEQAPVMVLLLDLDGRVQYASPFLEEVTGWRVDELRDQNWFSTCLPEGESFRRLCLQVMQAGDAQAVICPISTRAGLRRDIEWNGRRHCDADGNAQGILAVGHDVTARIAALKASEARLHELQRVAQIGSWELDIPTNTLSWSDEIYRIFELDPAHFGASYEAFLAAIHPEDRELVNHAYTRSLAAREPYDIVHRLLLPDGRIKYVHERCETSYGPDGAPLYSLGTVQDITAQHLAEKRLQESEERLRVAQRIGKMGSVDLDLSDGSVLLSDEALEMFGLPPQSRRSTVDELVSLLHPDERERVMQSLLAAAKGKVKHDLEHRIVRSDGSEIYVHATGELIGAKDSTQGRMIGTVRDITEQRRADARLRESEQRYRSVVSALSEGIVLNAPDGAIAACNAAAERILGLTVDQMLGRTPMDPRWRAIHEDGSPFPGESHPGSVTLRTGERQTNVVMGVHKPDGRLTWISINAEPIFEPGQTGRPSAVVASFADITERVNAEQQLRATRDRLAATLQAIPDLLFEIDGAGRYADFRAVDRALLGADPARFLGRKIDDVLPPDVNEIVQVALREAAETGTSFGHQYRLTVPGVERWFELSIARKPDPAGGKPSCVALARDITDRKHAEQELRRSDELFRAIFDGAAVGLMLTREFVPVRVNEAYARILGYSEQEMIQMGEQAHTQINFPEDRVYARGLAAQAMSGQRSGFLAEKRYRRKDGSEVWTHVSATRISGPEVESPLVLVQVVDITERKHAEQVIRKLNDELEARVRARTAELKAVNAELETFTYTVSHDLKAPLRGIEGYTRLLLEDCAPRLDANGQRMLHMVRAATEQMNQLIDDLLAYSLMERTDLHVEPVDIGALLNKLLQERGGEIRERAVKVVVAPSCPVVSVDRNGLLLVLRNLLENALKFSRAVAEPLIEVGSIDQGESCVLWIRDNGIGFNMRFHDTIFQIFQRLESSEKYTGTGLGLAIVRKAVGRMGGRVWAQSEPGNGATFYVEIPK